MGRDRRARRHTTTAKGTKNPRGIPLFTTPTMASGLGRSSPGGRPRGR
ncbi:MAG: hypothetical protein NTV51_13505 [Verrucomicrobia bacterium]|nr:hypothetical protein [Verrucomicrobiota bacterium]